MGTRGMLNVDTVINVAGCLISCLTQSKRLCFLITDRMDVSQIYPDLMDND